MDTQYKLFFGGAFAFDSRDEDYELAAAEDYRSQILGSVESLLRPKDMNGMSINDNILYIGPFYFEAESRKADEIVECEKQMIENCTDAVFVFDDASCPGTIAELMYANALHKHLHLFYVRHDDDDETESEMHTPCWYPLHFCQLTNSHTHLYECADLQDAARKVIDLVTFHYDQFDHQ
jgi:hypothetical protein